MIGIRAVAGWILAGAVTLVLVGVVWRADLIALVATFAVVAAAGYGSYSLLKT